MDWSSVEAILSANTILLALVINVLFGGERVFRDLTAFPTSLAGRIATGLEARYNRPQYTDEMRKADGISSLVLIVILGALLGALLGYVFNLFAYGWLVESLIVSIVLIHRLAYDQSHHLSRAMARAEEEAQATLALMAKRDTSGLSGADIARAGVEVNAKSLAEGLIGPVFYYLIFGLAGLFVFRLVNVSAGVIGTQTPFTNCFGWAPIRANRFLMQPVRWLTAVFVILAGLIVRSRHMADAIRTTLTQHGQYFDPCHGPAVAAFSGLMNVRLGGVVRYRAGATQADWIGADKPEPDRHAVALSRRLFAAASVIFALCLGGLALAGLPIPLFGF